jgi:hypothetical protein
VAVTSVGDEDLYRIPGASRATLVPVPVPVPGVAPADDARGTPVGVTHPDPASWSMVTDSSGPQVLRLRLTDVPGWHATIDGRAVPLERFAGVMLQVDVPGGRHRVELHYWPATFTAGIVLAAGAAVALGGAAVVGGRRRRRSDSRNGPVHSD